MSSELQQRSEDWFKIREGRFTASKIHRLLGKEGLKKTNDSIDNYAFEKAVESIYGKEQDTLISFDMQRGITQEPLAFNLFKNLKKYDFLEVSECFFYEFGKHAGASPDGRVSNNSTLEIKCPRRNGFFKLVAKGIEEIKPEYLSQMQMQMLCSNTEKCYFLNYYLENGFEYWHEIIVERDEPTIDLIKERLDQAIEIKLNYIEKLKNNKQF